jgi:plasmid stability protein
MPTLYVENVPQELYDALRRRAREHRKSISSEVLTLLEENIVTTAEKKSRQQFLRQAERLRSLASNSRQPFVSTEQMQREDRAR